MKPRRLLRNTVTFGSNEHLKAFGQAVAEALHIEIRIDVLADVSHTLPKLLHSFGPERSEKELETNLGDFMPVNHG